MLTRGKTVRRNSSYIPIVRTVCIVIVLLLHITIGHAARIKDIASIGGVRENQLIGYGLVVGLMGTGDTTTNGFTKETIANMLSRQGMSMNGRSPTSKNVAAVMITAYLPPFAKTGTRIDVTVASIGDATSLQGGQLIMTPLKATDGHVYAVAQGALVLGGYSAGGASASTTKNQTNVGIIVNGALVEREVPYAFGRDRKFLINLYSPDFTTAVRLSDIISRTVKGIEAFAIDSETIAVRPAPSSAGNLTEIISVVENIDVPLEKSAVVVMNEKTGTVVMGENVRISTIAIAHGNLSIQVKDKASVSQPLPFAPAPPAGSTPQKDRKGGVIIAPGGQTVVTKETTTLNAQEEKKQLMVVPGGVTIQDMVSALNAIGVTPRDLITIIQTIKAAGALQADLRII